MAELDAGVIPHKAGSTEDYDMDFGDFPQASASPAVTIASFTLVAAAGLTVAGQVKVGEYKLRGRFSGGSAPNSYLVTGTVTWSNGTISVRTGTLKLE